MSINASLQNDSFNDKKRVKFDSAGKKTRNGYSDGPHSEIEVSHNVSWGPDQIRARGIKLLKFMEDRWNFRFKNDEEREKLLFLNLGGFIPRSLLRGSSLSRTRVNKCAYNKALLRSELMGLAAFQCVDYTPVIYVRSKPFPTSAPWRRVISNYGLGRDLMGAMLARTEEIGSDISTISRLFQGCALSPISIVQSG